MKKSLALFLTLVAVSLTASASEKVLSSKGTEVPFKASVTRTGEAPPKVGYSTVFVGERIVRDDKGSCFKETTSLTAMPAVKAMDTEVQMPSVQSRREAVACPA